jgi:DNA polymerase-3 subunit delta
MAIVRNDQADGFVSAPRGDASFFLVHGNEEGLIHERAKRLVEALNSSSSDPLSLVRLDGEVVARDPGRLLDEAHAISLFGGRRTIWLESKGRDLTNAVLPLFEGPALQCAVVIEAGNLKKGAVLRAFFETTPKAVSIECYPDEKLALRHLIESEARAANLEISEDATELLIGLLGADRQTSRSEVVKLVTYVIGKPGIDIEDVQAVVAGAAPSASNRIVDYAFSGPLDAVERECSRFLSEGGDSNVVAARAIARALALLQGQNGRSGMLAGPWLRAEVERWSWERLAPQCSALLEMTANSRRESGLSAEIVTRALWMVAVAARAQRAR